LEDLVNHFVDCVVKDRRLAQRHMIKTPLRVRVRRSTMPEQRCQSENISDRGIFFSTGLHVAIGTMVDVLFKMPSEVSGKPTTEWLCTGHVVRLEATATPGCMHGVGVQFDCYEVSRAR
jgi:hypothetical protein